MFLIVEEGLARAIRQAESKGILEGISVVNKIIVVSMIQFADDTIFVCNDETRKIVAIKSVLRCFELASRLKVNFYKSKLGSIGVSLVMVKRFFCSS